MGLSYYSADYFLNQNLVESPENYRFLLTDFSSLAEDECYPLFKLLHHLTATLDSPQCLSISSQGGTNLYVQDLHFPISKDEFLESILEGSDDQALFLSQQEVNLYLLFEEDLCLLAVKKELFSQLEQELSVVGFQTAEVYCQTHPHFFSQSEQESLLHLYGEESPTKYQRESFPKTRAVLAPYALLQTWPRWRRYSVIILSIVAALFIVMGLDYYFGELNYFLGLVMMLVLGFSLLYLICYLFLLGKD